MGLSHLPRIERDGRLIEGEKYFTGGGFVLPTEGVEILVERNGATLGRLVLEPRGAVRCRVISGGSRHRAGGPARVVVGTREALHPLG